MSKRRARLGQRERSTLCRTLATFVAIAARVFALISQKLRCSVESEATKPRAPPRRAGARCPRSSRLRPEHESRLDETLPRS